MKKTELRVNNHFITQHLLNKWLNNDGKIWSYRLLVSHENVPLWVDKSSSGIASQDYLYCLHTPDGTNDEMEKWLCDEIENKAVLVINKVNDESTMTKSDWCTLIKYALVQDLRTPESFFKFNKIISNDMPEISKNLLKEIKHILDSNQPEIHQKTEYDSAFPFKVTIKPIQEKSELKIETICSSGRAAWVYFIKDLTEKFYHLTLKHKWTIIKPFKGEFWPLSDSPVIKLNIYNSNVKYDFNGNWSNTNGCILMPLGPEHLLFTQIGIRLFNNNQRVSKRLTSFIQQIIAESAFEWIYSIKPSDEIINYRQRVEDNEEFKAREEFWRNWNKVQSKSESEFH